MNSIQKKKNEKQYSSFHILDFQSGDVGLAITQTFGLTGMVQWFIRQTSVLENQMTSVERINEYANIPQEGNLQSLPGKRMAE